MARDKAYLEAEKKIEEARKTGAKKLDLSQKYSAKDEEKLTELPESVGNLTQLQSLNLRNNKLTALPEWLGNLTQLQSLNLFSNKLTALPESLGNLTQLQSLNLHKNQLTALPESLGNLTQLQSLNLGSNQLTALPESLGNLTQLQSLNLSGNQLTALPEWLGNLTQLQSLRISNNPQLKLLKGIGNLQNLQLLYIDNNPQIELSEEIGVLKNLKQLAFFKNYMNDYPNWLWNLKSLEMLQLGYNNLKEVPLGILNLTFLQELWLENNFLTNIPPSLAQLEHLKELYLDANPLDPELAEAYKQGLDAVKAYLRAKAKEQITLNEAKLILVGEGEVGKSCLLGALRGDPYQEGLPTTHGIEIKPVNVIDPDGQTEITLNGWDFGGQRVYRPTHQLFFSAPAVYLVVWKPREGPQQGFVREWIKLIKHREPDAKILVVATHGGPQQRQPDIDRQELWDIFGKTTVLDFFHVDSKPDETGIRRGIEELKTQIALVAAGLPEMGRTVPKTFQDVRTALKDTNAAYLPIGQVMSMCREHKMDDELARLFLTISHRLGHLIRYEHDPALRDIVVLKPDWLATAISLVLDDEQTRNAHGLVRFSRLGQLWHDPDRDEEFHYSQDLHPIFLRLMERFDLSYRVADPTAKGDSDPQSLIAQLVPDNRPETELENAWQTVSGPGDARQMQICRVVDDKGQSASAEGLFYWLIVRLHKYSLGRVNYCDSVHWQRGLVLDDDYNGRALLEHTGTDVRITVSAPYPERFLVMLTEEVKYLVESFWEGLRCDVMVPCLNPAECAGLFEVRKLIENKKRDRPEQPCPICNEWQSIDALLGNAPAARPVAIENLISSKDVLMEVRGVRQLVLAHESQSIDRFDFLKSGLRETLSKIDAGFNTLMTTLTDEAKEGPRLYSFQPIETGFFDRPKWVSAKFRLTLWCEHSRLPLTALNPKGDKRGVYELNFPKEWLVAAAPWLRMLAGTLSLVLPVASSATKLLMNETAYKAIENELDLGKNAVETMIKGGEQAGKWLTRKDDTDLGPGGPLRAEGAVLRQLHTWLKAEDPSFGGLVRVMNKRQEFLWVHEQFTKEY